MDIFEKLSLAGLVPVIKVEDANDAVPLCRALSEGGLPVAEITFRTAAAEQAIRNVSSALPEVILGAGTVLSVDQVKRAVDAGAKFIVSPGLNPAVVGYCVENHIPVLPGCANPSDIETAMSFGLDTVKFFPAEAAGGVSFIKAISAPYGGMKFVPTGGINEKNLMDYLSFPKVRAAGGSWMVPGDAVKAKDWNRVTELTRQAVKVMLGLKLEHIGINSGSPEKALADAKALCALTGLALKDGDRLHEKRNCRLCHSSSSEINPHSKAGVPASHRPERPPFTRLLLRIAVHILHYAAQTHAVFHRQGEHHGVRLAGRAGLFHDGVHHGVLLFMPHGDKNHLFFVGDGNAEKLRRSCRGGALGVHDRSAARARTARRVHYQIGSAVFGDRHNQIVGVNLLFFHCSHLAVLLFNVANQILHGPRAADARHGQAHRDAAAGHVDAHAHDHLRQKPVYLAPASERQHDHLLRNAQTKYA